MTDGIHTQSGRFCLCANGVGRFSAYSCRAISAKPLPSSASSNIFRTVSAAGFVDYHFSVFVELVTEQAILPDSLTAPLFLVY